MFNKKQAPRNNWIKQPPKPPSLFKEFFGEVIVIVNIFLILVIFSTCILLFAKGVGPLHNDVDQRASDYSQLE
jgi:hypothetical protein